MTTRRHRWAGAGPCPGWPACRRDHDPRDPVVVLVLFLAAAWVVVTLFALALIGGAR